MYLGCWDELLDLRLGTVAGNSVAAGTHADPVEAVQVELIT